MTIPNSEYNIDNTNNTLVINGTSYVLLVGNYGANSLASEINSVIYGTDVSVAYESTTLDFTFTGTATPFTIGAASTILYCLGYDATSYTAQKCNDQSLCVDKYE